MKERKFLAFFLVQIFLVSLFLLSQEKPVRTSLLDNLASRKDYQSKRVSSYDQSGKNEDRLVVEPGEMRRRK